MAETVQTTSPESKILRQVSGWLTREFGDRVDADIIRRVAIDEIARLRGARVQEFVATISWRQARARLAIVRSNGHSHPDVLRLGRSLVPSG